MKIAVNGTMRDWIVVNQGIPSGSALYDDSCNGTWLLMKDIFKNSSWATGSNSAYADSFIHSYLNSTFLGLLDSNIKDAIKKVKIPYMTVGGADGELYIGTAGLACKIFLLGGYEIGWTQSDSYLFPVDGAKLDFFGASSGGNSKRIAHFGGSAARYWLRSPPRPDAYSAMNVENDGSFSSYATFYSFGVRPAMILPFETLVADDGTVLG